MSALDRDALIATLTSWLEDDYPYQEGDTSTEVDDRSVAEGANKVLALMQPADGIVLTTREAALAAEAAEVAAKDLEHSTLATRYAGLVSEFRALVTKLRTPTASTTEERTR